jgi:hypothetical protein
LFVPRFVSGWFSQTRPIPRQTGQCRFMLPIDP